MHVEMAGSEFGRLLQRLQTYESGSNTEHAQTRPTPVTQNGRPENYGPNSVSEESIEVPIDPSFPFVGRKKRESEELHYLFNYTYKGTLTGLCFKAPRFARGN